MRLFLLLVLLVLVYMMGVWFTNKLDEEYFEGVITGAKCVLLSPEEQQNDVLCVESIERIKNINN